MTANLTYRPKVFAHVWATYSLLVNAFIFCGIVNVVFVKSAFAVNESRLEIRTIAIAPYGFENGVEPNGIYFDLANQLGKDAGFITHNIIYPYARIVSELKAGQTDLTIMFKYKALSDDVLYIAPLPTLQNVVIGLAGTDIHAVGDLKDKRLGYLRGAKFSDVIDNDPQILKYEIRDYFQGVEMLKAGRVYAIIGPMDAMLSAAISLGDNIDIFGQPFVVSKRTPWVQMSKKSRHTGSIDILRKHLDIILTRGDLALLRKKYIKTL
jgi:polar amino acid transport system substrate-binding protein